ncbi:MAG TPA: hypothetical protein VGZ02_00495 [Candidatus Baltobacteraceae bacterium]|jgi:hypothetical protein|nr:hypothetical protein [Candidatus Baltobacteraceae bacterium]
MHDIRPALLIALVSLSACSAPVHRVAERAIPPSCAERATAIVAENAGLITSRHYAQASRATEAAARVSLSCKDANPARAFSDRWRGANALVVAAELAHEANDIPRAHRLLHEGYSILYSLHPPHRVNDVTSSLIAQKLDGARQDLAGQWAYW